MDKAEIEAVQRSCTRFISGAGMFSLRQEMFALAEAIPPDMLPDRYGEGEVIRSLETEVAALARQGGRRLHAQRHDGPADCAAHLVRPPRLPKRGLPPDLPPGDPRGRRATSSCTGCTACWWARRHALITLADLEKVRRAAGGPAAGAAAA